MEKPWYKSLSVWGPILIFVGGGMEALGVAGSLEYIKQLCMVLGLPTLGVGIRKALG